MTYSAIVEQRAERVLNALSAKYGFDPATILIWLPVVQQVIASLAGCFKVNDNVSEQNAQSRLAYLHAKNPGRLHDRTTGAIIRENRKARRNDKSLARLSYDEASKLASAVIEDALSEPAESFSNVFEACLEVDDAYHGDE